MCRVRTGPSGAAHRSSPCIGKTRPGQSIEIVLSPRSNYPAMSTPPQPPVRLLIVDDDEDLRQSLAQHFRRAGMTVTEAGSAEEALVQDGTRFDVAVLDLHLPGLDGIELLARLKELQPEVEALMLTAHSSIETAVQAMRRGAH